MFETAPISISVDGEAILTAGTDFYPADGGEPSVSGTAREDTPVCAGATEGKVFGRGNALFKLTVTAMRTHADHAAAVDYVITQTAALTGLEGALTGTKHAATAAHINAVKGDVRQVTSILVMQITCTGLTVTAP